MMLPTITMTSRFNVQGPAHKRTGRLGEPARCLKLDTNTTIGVATTGDWGEGKCCLIDPVPMQVPEGGWGAVIPETHTGTGPSGNSGNIAYIWGHSWARVRRRCGAGKELFCSISALEKTGGPFLALEIRNTWRDHRVRSTWEVPLSSTDPIAFRPRAANGMVAGRSTVSAGSAPTHPDQAKTAAFSRHELNAILAVYGRKVASGEWRDYALDFSADKAVFSIFRRASECPLFTVEKCPRLSRRQGAYSVIAFSGLILKRGHELDRVLAVLD